ncbi:YbaB/EbfC family nucleoid-associated protein [Streptomyces cucumeris]|uniref:YbaB/EbfC family nucleoid-associated protein n=1 Tax=Streptomyces cucumeris TaxID=2962890 RepID=UPI003D742A66
MSDQHMGSPGKREAIGERLAKARANLEETQKAAARAQEQLSTASATARSRDGSVEVLVNAQGQLGEVKFLNGKYRTMGAAQLSASLLEATGQAHAQMARLVLDTFRPLADKTQDDRPAMEGVDIDWDRIFGPLVSTVERGTATRCKAGDGLRDEIHEDEERR